MTHFDVDAALAALSLSPLSPPSRYIDTRIHHSCGKTLPGTNTQPIGTAASSPLLAVPPVCPEKRGNLAGRALFLFVQQNTEKCRNTPQTFARVRRSRIQRPFNTQRTVRASCLRPASPVPAEDTRRSCEENQTDLLTFAARKSHVERKGTAGGAGRSTSQKSARLSPTNSGCWGSRWVG